MVPTLARSSSSSTGMLTAPGTWSSANSEGLRTSMIMSNRARVAASGASMTSMSDMMTAIYPRIEGLEPKPGEPACKTQPSLKSRA